MPVFFNGRLWVSPATMSVVDDSAMYNKNANVGNVLAIIGKSEGGEPFTPLAFGSAQEARSVLRSGYALKAIEKAFDPSSETAGPSTVLFVRVNPAVQSALALVDAASATVINLASTDYGVYTNQIKVKIEAGSTIGKKLTSQFGSSYYSQDNVNRNCFSVTYTGTQTTATITVAPASVTLFYGASSQVFDLNNFNTVGKLVDAINSVTGFTATVLDANSEKASLYGLDNVIAQTVKNSVVTVTGTLQAIVDWFNGTGEGFLTATRPATAGTLPSNVAFSYLTGGSDGTTTTAEWQKGFDALQAADVQWVVPVSAESAVHAMADTHCAYMSNIARMERRAIVGGDTGVTDDAALLAAKAINSDRTSYTHLGLYDYDDSGKLTLYPAYIMAALLAGAFSGVNPGTALTNRTLKIRGIERKLRNPTDTDKLILGGVLAVEETSRGYKCVKSITTWLANTNYNRVEVSVGVACDFVSRNVRNILDDLRGKKGSPAILSEAVSRTDSILRTLAMPEPMGPAVIVGDKINPAYKNITASLEGDVLRVEFQCSPVIPVNYIPIVIHAVPYSGSASA